jgi:3-oxoacyl-[acyl-carrier-protein] synthase II
MRIGAPRRIAVTGVGVVAPGATGVAEFWAALLDPAAPARVRRVDDADADAADFVRRCDARRLDRFAAFAVHAAGQALNRSGLRAAVDPDRVAVVIGTGMGGLVAHAEAVRMMAERGRVPPLTGPKTMPNAAASAVSMAYGLRGPTEALATACAAGTHSIGYAARLVATGLADAAVAGGADGCLTDADIAAFDVIGALSPSGVSRPFDTARDGFCAAEGAGVVVLEPLDDARRRSAPVLLEVLGAGSSADAHHITAPDPTGSGAIRCVRAALADACLAPGAIRHVNAHGTATARNDASEARALRAVFGTVPPITSVKGVTGHPLGAAGAVEAVAVALTVAHRTLPPTAGTVDVEEADLDVVLQARPWVPGPVLSTSFGFGGLNGALVLAPVDGSVPGP